MQKVYVLEHREYVRFGAVDCTVAGVFSNKSLVIEYCKRNKNYMSRLNTWYWYIQSEIIDTPDDRSQEIERIYLDWNGNIIDGAPKNDELYSDE